jgi:hypothetical protein
MISLRVSDMESEFADFLPNLAPLFEIVVENPELEHFVLKELVPEKLAVYTGTGILLPTLFPEQMSMADVTKSSLPYFNPLR